MRPMRLKKDESGFTLVEMLVVIMVAGIISASLLAVFVSLQRTSVEQQVRVFNQDSARLAMYEMTRYIRAASSSESNQTKVSDAIEVAGPQELVFYVDLDGDGKTDRVRYYLSGTTLRMQTAKPNTNIIPHTYPNQYSTDSVVILSGVTNGTEPIFTYYGYDEDANELYRLQESFNSKEARVKIVTVGINLSVNEKPEVVKGPVDINSQVLIRQRYEGGINVSTGI